MVVCPHQLALVFRDTERDLLLLMQCRYSVVISESAALVAITSPQEITILLCGHRFSLLLIAVANIYSNRICRCRVVEQKGVRKSTIILLFPSVVAMESR